MVYSYFLFSFNAILDSDSAQSAKSSILIAQKRHITGQKQGPLINGQVPKAYGYLQQNSSLPEKHWSIFKMESIKGTWSYSVNCGEAEACWIFSVAEPYSEQKLCIDFCHIYVDTKEFAWQKSREEALNHYSNT